MRIRPHRITESSQPDGPPHRPAALPARRARHAGPGVRRRTLGTAVLAVVVTAAALLQGSGTAGAAPVPVLTAAAATTDCTPVPAPPPAQVIPAGTYYGVRLSAGQVQAAQVIISVGKERKLSARASRIALAVALMESSLNPKAVAGDRVGLFQQPPTKTYSAHSRSSAVGASRMFFRQLTNVLPHYRTDPRADWQIAVQVQGAYGMATLFRAWYGLSATLTQGFFKAVPPYDFDPPLVLPEGCPSGTGFDAGNIISDQVFYDTGAMTTSQVRAFINEKNAACTGKWCLRNIRIDAPRRAADTFCKAYSGGTGKDAAAVITAVSVACGVNPQVMLVTLQKESSLLTRTKVTEANYDAAWGWHCPDTGPDGAPNCDPAYAGFFNQAYGAAKQWARYRVQPGKYHYQAGETAMILWNVEASKCGGSLVHIENAATASLYNYTPYQPNMASLAAYPGTGDRCSSYGNRNFFFLFTSYFGSTGGGTPVALSGSTVTIPASPYVPAGLAGARITAPNAAVARGIAAGLGALGTPYVWGGGTYGGPADEGCARGGGALNSFQGIVGFDCSGLTAYVLKQAGFTIPAGSTAQRSHGTSVSWSAGRPGDIVGYPGHVAIYLGYIGSTRYMLEAPYPGAFVRVRPVRTTDVDKMLHRYWG